MVIIMERERGKQERETVEKWQTKRHGQPCSILFGLRYFSVRPGLRGMEEDEGTVGYNYAEEEEWMEGSGMQEKINGAPFVLLRLEPPRMKKKKGQGGWGCWLI